MAELYEKRGYLLEDFRLFHLQDSRGVNTEYHYHEFCKLLLLVSGSGSYTVEGARYELRPGDVVLLGNQCVHRSSFEPDRPYERVIIYISPDFLRRNSLPQCNLEDSFSGVNGHVLRPQKSRFQKLLTIAAALEQELSANRVGSTIAGSGLLLQLLVELLRLQLRADSQHPAPIRPKSSLVQALLAHLEQNWDQPTSIDELASSLFTSRYHLMHQFRQETGTTIHRFIAERRLFHARDLISRGMSSTEACFHVGFGSYSSFARAYNKLFGTTPTGRAVKPEEDNLE